MIANLKQRQTSGAGLGRLQPHRKRRALTGLTVHRNFSTQLPDNLAADGQPQAGAGRAGLAAGLAAIEPLKQVGVIFGGAAVAAVIGKKEERAVASLFSPGVTHAMPVEFAGINDFEGVAFLVILSGTAA